MTLEERFRKDTDMLLSLCKNVYCGEGRDKVQRGDVKDLLVWAMKENNFAQWHWGKGVLSTDYFMRYTQLFKQYGINLYFDQVPTEEGFSITFVENVDGLDFTNSNTRVVVKNRRITVGRNMVHAYGNAFVIGIDKCDALMYDNSTFIGGYDECVAELFDNSQGQGKGRIYKSNK